MFKGLLIASSNGNPVYSFFAQSTNVDQKLLIANILITIQTFASEISSSSDGNNIRSVELSENLLTFRLINLHTEMGKPVQYYFALLTDLHEGEQPEFRSLLEYLTLSFLSYDGSKFRRDLIKSPYSNREYRAFDKFMGKIINLDLKTIPRNFKPIPGSLLQGVLNEIKDYFPLSDIVRLHSKIVALGPSYAWLSDDLSKEEEEELLGRLRELLSNTFGESLCDTVVARVNEQLSSETLMPASIERKLGSYPCPLCNAVISGVVVREADILQSKRSPVMVQAKCPRGHDIALYIDKQFAIRQAEPLIATKGKR